MPGTGDGGCGLQNGSAPEGADRTIDGHKLAVRVAIPSGARGTAVAHAGACETMVRRAGDSSGAEQRNHRWSPVRIRFVHLWIAQLGRASDFSSECRGFDSRSKHDLSRHDPEREFHTRTRPARRVAPDRLAPVDAANRRSGSVAGPASSRRADPPAQRRDLSRRDARARSPRREHAALRDGDARAASIFLSGPPATHRTHRDATYRRRANRSIAATSTSGSDHQCQQPRRECRACLQHVLDQAGRDRRRRARPGVSQPSVRARPRARRTSHVRPVAPGRGAHVRHFRTSLWWPRRRRADRAPGRTAGRGVRVCRHRSRRSRPRVPARQARGRAGARRTPAVLARTGRCRRRARIARRRPRRAPGRTASPASARPAVEGRRGRRRAGGGGRSGLHRWLAAGNTRPRRLRVLELPEERGRRRGRPARAVGRGVGPGVADPRPRVAAREPRGQRTRDRPRSPRGPRSRSPAITCTASCNTACAR